MKKARHAIAMVFLAVTVGCSGQMPLATPPPATERMALAHTSDTGNLVEAVMMDEDLMRIADSIIIESDNHGALLSRVLTGDVRYMISHHIPAPGSIRFWSIPLVQDGIALLVHPDNPVMDLTLAELRRIYRGYLTNWNELGGYDETITLYSREAGAGLRMEFERLVMGQERTSPNAQVLSSSELMIERLQTDRTGIGYIPVSMLSTNANVVAIDGVLPSLTSISDQAYPLRMTVYGIGLEEPTEAFSTIFSTIQRAIDGNLTTRFAPLPR